MIRLHAATADDTRRIGALLGTALASRPVDRAVLLTLSGDLGAGKTTLVGGLLAALGHEGPVRSPTYTLIEPYRLGGQDVQHCDLYRLRHPDELEDLGWRDLAVPGALLIVEWPERADSRLGVPDLALTLRYAAAGRDCEIVAGTLTGQVLAAQLSGQT